MKALLDTDIVSELIRAKNTAVLARADAHKREHGALAFSAMTVFEITQGLHRLSRSEQAANFLLWLRDCEVLELDEAAATLAGEIGGALLQAGRVIGIVDTCIAATALRHGRAIVTGNERHYELVRAAGFPVTIENWREPTP